MPNPASPRRPIVAGNWKMNTTIDEGLALVDGMRPLIDDVSVVDRVVCPPYISLHAIADRLRDSEIGRASCRERV